MTSILSTSPRRFRTSTRARTWATRWSSSRPTCSPGTTAGSGTPVRFQTGTDDNSLKNVLAAEAAGVGVQEFVDANAAAFAALRRPLSLSVDDVIRTSTDPRHRAGRRAALAGLRRRRRPVPQALRGPVLRRLRAVLHRRTSSTAAAARSTAPRRSSSPRRTGSSGCPATPGGCATRSTAAGCGSSPPSAATRCSRSSTAGCADFSVSRSAGRAHGWGIPVPGDPGPGDLRLVGRARQLPHRARLRRRRERRRDRWWTGADRRVHVLGKGVLRFHAVYWPAMLLSAGPAAADRHPRARLPHRRRPQDQQVRRRRGRPGRAGRRTTAPTRVRWWLLRDVPSIGDADFTVSG